MYMSPVDGQKILLSSRSKTWNSLGLWLVDDTRPNLRPRPKLVPDRRIPGQVFPAFSVLIVFWSAGAFLTRPALSVIGRTMWRRRRCDRRPRERGIIGRLCRCLFLGRFIAFGRASVKDKREMGSEHIAGVSSYSRTI